MSESTGYTESLKSEARKVGADPLRAEVWDAFSEFFLDTEQSEEDLNWIAGRIADSPFSYRELGHILFKEVGPVCVGNLYVLPGGVWSGFASDWLIPKCFDRQKKYPFRETANLDEIPFLYHVLSPVFSDAYKMLLRVKGARESAKQSS